MKYLECALNKLKQLIFQLERNYLGVDSSKWRTKYLKRKLIFKKETRGKHKRIRQTYNSKCFGAMPTYAKHQYWLFIVYPCASSGLTVASVVRIVVLTCLPKTVRFNSFFFAVLFCSCKTNRQTDYGRVSQHTLCVCVLKAHYYSSLVRSRIKSQINWISTQIEFSCSFAC